MSTRYMLDTNMASYLIKGTYPKLDEKVLALPLSVEIVVSVITEAELRLGLLKKGNPPRLKTAVESFLAQIEILSWGSEAAGAYAELRNHLETSGAPLAAMDMLIGAHALSNGSVLVTHDKALLRLNNYFPCVDWLK
jgi:tRNA(fMet)-specific endonuclease VapC